jgi:hypothetical protein
VTDLGFDSGGRLIIFVDSGQTLAQARAQPRLGWGCAEPAGASRVTLHVVARPTGFEGADAISIRSRSRLQMATWWP